MNRIGYTVTEEYTETFVNLPCRHDLCPACGHDTALVTEATTADVTLYKCVRCAASDYEAAEVREL